jgi:hypothetical protein
MKSEHVIGAMALVIAYLLYERQTSGFRSGRGRIGRAQRQGTDGVKLFDGVK